jgi:hypothetical protein
MISWEGDVMRALRFTVVVSCLVSTVTSAQTPRDLTKLDPCKVLTSADLAAATKGKVSTSVGGGLGATACMWVIDSPSAAGTYQLMFQKADLIKAVWDVSSPAEKGTPVPSLWDEAYLKPPGPNSDQYILVALKKGDMAIEVHGVAKDAVTSLGKTAISRLK